MDAAEVFTVTQEFDNNSIYVNQNIPCHGQLLARYVEFKNSQILNDIQNVGAILYKLNIY